jgi:PAS domain S-box-containing protein
VGASGPMTALATDDPWQELEPRLRELTERVQSLVAVADADFSIRYVSPAIERVLGYRADELSGAFAPELTHPDDRERVVQAVLALISGADGTARFTLRARHKDGSYRQMFVSAHNLLTDPALRAILIIAQDVTEPRQMLAALAEREQRFRMLAENSRDVIARYRLAPTPQLEYVSPSVERVTGYSPEELYADPQLYLKLIAPEDRERLGRLISGAAREELTRPQTLCWIRKDGARVFIEQLTVLIYENRTLVAAECSCRDVTEKVQLEEQLRQAQKLEAVGTLAAGMAHDLNNLLMAMFGHLGRLQTRLAADAEAMESVAALKDTARRAALLSDELLACAHTGVRSAEVVDLNRVLAELWPALRALLPPEVALHGELRAERGKVRIDRGQLEQVLMNLVVNSKEAMPSGGSLTLSTRNTVPDCVEFAVTDTGVGIREADLPRVFDPFFTTKQRSLASGLGLAAAYGIVRRFGGSISVQSTLGRGARFTVELPTTDDPLALPEPAQLAGTEDGRGETVLLVEDQRAVREVLAQLLREAGYQVLEAGSGAAALTVAGQRSIDLLITDIVMPDMSGGELLERMRADRPELPVVCMSGYAGDQVDPRSTPSARTAFLAKPFLPEELLSTLRRLLG